MKTILILSCILLTANTFAQRFEKDYDFSKVDLNTLDVDKLLAYRDSLFHAMKYDSINALIDYRNERTYSPRYNALNVGLGAQIASLKSLNRSLKAAGFDRMNDSFVMIPIGFSFKGKRWMGDYAIQASIRNKVENDDWRMSLSGGSFTMMIGYDIANTKRFQFYPQVGLSYQTANIKMLNKHAADVVSDITDFGSIAGNSSISRSSVTFNYGVEADYFVNFFEGSGIILGVVYGMTADIIPGKFKIDRDRLSLDINKDRFKSSYFGLVLKVAAKDF